MTDFETLGQTWQSTHTRLTDDIKTLKGERRALQTALIAFERDAPQGAWQTIKRPFNRLTTGWSLKRKLKKSENAVMAVYAERRRCATDFLESLGDMALDNVTVRDTTGKDLVLHDVYDRLQDAQDTLHSTRKTVVQAIQKCKDASTGEVLDIVGNNKALSLMSHFSTSEAKEWVVYAVDAIEHLQGKISGLPQLTLDNTLGRNFDFNIHLDLALDMVSDFLGDISSLQNMKKLDNAVRNLESTVDRLDEIDDEMTMKADDVLMRALGVWASENASVRTLVEAARPYLRQDRFENRKLILA